jgi:hypothetical protein
VSMRERTNNMRQANCIICYHSGMIFISLIVLCWLVVLLKKKNVSLQFAECRRQRNSVHLLSAGDKEEKCLSAIC